MWRPSKTILNGTAMPGSGRQRRHQAANAAAKPKHALVEVTSDEPRETQRRRHAQEGENILEARGGQSRATCAPPAGMLPQPVVNEQQADKWVFNSCPLHRAPHPPGECSGKLQQSTVALRGPCGSRSPTSPRITSLLAASSGQHNAPSSHVAHRQYEQGILPPQTRSAHARW